MLDFLFYGGGYYACMEVDIGNGRKEIYRLEQSHDLLLLKPIFDYFTSSKHFH